MFHYVRSGTCSRCNHGVQVSHIKRGGVVMVAPAWRGRCPICKNKIELDQTSLFFRVK